MYFHDRRLQYPVRVAKPDPTFARMLQQAIGGVEGEIRVCMQYFFQAWNSRGPTKYRDMLLHTATEEIGHIEMLATAVALNLEKAPATLQEESAKDGIVGAVLGGGERPRHAIEGMIHKHLLSAGLGAMPVDSDGVPFDMSHIYSSGNIAADMYANVTAESTGRVLATRIYNAAHDEGMKDFLAFLIGRDTMHQQQWLAVLEELGGPEANLPIPNSFPQSQENQELNYVFVATALDGEAPPAGRWTEGRSVDGKSEFSVQQMKGEGQAPALGAARADSGAQAEQISHGTAVR